MTLFLGDFSHYDDVFTLEIAKRIKADGITVVTHKVSEGMGGLDDEADEAFTYSRQAGFEFIGAYAVPRSGDGRAQARVAIARCDVIAPWWRSFPGWIWQVDLERWPYDAVPAVDGREMADEFATTGKKVVVYASKGQYGDQLTGWPYPLWNARYPSSRQAPYRSLYPGDAETSSSGWQRYSGKMPDFWQYASTATIGGLTTCDVSAYRGTLDQLRALLTSGGTSTSTGGTVATIPAPDNPGRSDTDVLRDVGNLRNVLYGPLAAYKPGYAPPEGTVLDALVRFLRDPATGPAAAPISQDALNTAVALALRDPAVVSTLVKAINDDEAARMAQ